jgi:hypothetical protein
MIDKITLTDFIEEVYNDQIESIKSLDLTPKEKNEQKETIKETILECESLDDLKSNLLKSGYRDEEINEYLLSFFIEL